MDKITYLSQLAEGLARWVPERERQDILRYYAEYFEEAGQEREAEVIQELGDPWALSSRLAVEGGYVSQEGAAAWTPRRNKRKVWPVVVVAAVAVVAIVAISAASFASLIGNLVGRTVYDEVTFVGPVTGPIGEDTGIAVSEEEHIVNVVPVPSEEVGDKFGFIDLEGTDGFWAMEDGWLEPFRAIDADISMGNITITGGEDYTLAIQQGGNLGGYTVKWEIQGDTLKLRDGSSGSHNIGLDGLGDLLGKKGLDVVITVPEGEMLQKITAKTDFGNVYLSDLDVEVKVEAKTDMGNVDCCEVRTAQKVELKTSMGNVTFGLDEDDIYSASGLDIDLETDMGDVEVNLECYETECAYELETDMGKVTINGESRGTKAERKGSASVKLEAESSMGNVDVYFLDDRW